MRAALPQISTTHHDRKQNKIHIGRPLPLPAGAPPSAGLDERGLVMVSSTDKMRHAASEAAVRALIFTIDGSHTQAAKLSVMSSELMSTPNQVPPATDNKSENQASVIITMKSCCDKV